MEKRESKKQRMTLEKLAEVSQQQFFDIRKEMVTKEYLDKKLEYFATKKDLERFATKKDLERFATKKDLEFYATKQDLIEFKEDVIETVHSDNRKVLESNDKVITKLDIILKDQAAHTLAHSRLDDTLDAHQRRIKKLEEKVR